MKEKVAVTKIDKDYRCQRLGKNSDPRKDRGGTAK